MKMHHLNTTHEAHSQTYNEQLDIKALYASPIMEAKNVSMHVLAHSPYENPKYLLLLLIWASLYDPECYEVLKSVVTYLMSP